MMNGDGLTVWTIGHSTRSLGDFLDLLSLFAIENVADVRRFPTSRKYPHFDKEALRKSLEGTGVQYVLLPELGGRREPLPDSHNTLWRNQSFRGYADYMETKAFRVGIDRLLDVARQGRTAFMCAEAVWWRCHRSLIADYLKAEGICVRHIVDWTTGEIHPYTSAARLRNGRLSYSPGP